MQRHANMLLLAIIFGLAVMWTGCSGPSTEPIEEPLEAGEGAEAAAAPGRTTVGEVTDVKVPSWFVEIPDDPNYIYAVGTHYSKDMQTAITDATGVARNDMINQLETKVSSMFKRFREEVGLGEDAEIMSMSTDVSKSVASDVLRIAKRAQQEIVTEKGREVNLYRVYVLLELPLGEMNAAVVDKVKANKNLYTQFKASQAFQELESEVAKYEEWKKEKGM